MGNMHFSVVKHDEKAGSPFTFCTSQKDAITGERFYVLTQKRIEKYCAHFPRENQLKKMEEVRQEYAILQKNIASLGEGITNIVQENEIQFFESFKVFMQSVKDDFIRCEERMEKKEQAIREHELVKKLEKEKNFYKKQALELDCELNNAKKRELELVQNREELENDRFWLTTQLKEVLKSNERCEEDLLE